MIASAAPADRVSSDLIEAARRFFQEDPARILRVAGGLRAPDRTIESTVLGTSMGGTIPAGSRVRIELAAPRRHEVGEVIAFVAGGHVVVHRVVRRARRGYVLTRGDAALVPDPPVSTDRVLGAVVAVQRDGAWGLLADRARRSFPARFVVSTLQAVVTGTMSVSPRAAEALVTLFHRSRGLRAAFRPYAGPLHRS